MKPAADPNGAFPAASLLLLACCSTAVGPEAADSAGPGPATAAIGAQDRGRGAGSGGERGPRRPQPDYPAHVAALRQKLPHPGFHIVVEAPFVVVGDESEEMVQSRAKRTVKWATDLLKRDFFAADPDQVIDIWLFKDRASYQKHTRQVFGQVPTTPFGYYSPAQRALIMNIATGGGTLVHEIVHPFVAANFPGCPAWFNEGLGSLFEQCQERDGHIVGLTNWRLAGLQKAIERGVVPSFATLTGTTDRQFYGEDPGTNYAQARYLCYYLQEKGLLRRFYRAFHAARRDDPTGYKTLQKVLGREDMDAFQAEWQRFVAQLRF